MKRWLLRASAILGVLGVLGFLVAALGLVPIAASSGHWSVTEWVLQFGKRRSVATHASSIELPALDVPWLVAKGAGHYETACRPCHGSPELQHPRIARAMVPPPPYLGPRVAAWKPAELFYIVKHGLKFTGMPAWPTQHRDDEVQAMVAFLLVLPTLDGAQYDRLVRGDAPPSNELAPIADLAATPAPREVIASCARCHGADGLGRGSPAFPKLAGQKKDYLVAALEAYQRDARPSGIMQAVAAGLDASQVRAVAEHYARLPAPPPHSGEPAAAAAIERGRTIATRGVPERRVPSCSDCHGPQARKANQSYPLLAGQWQEYLVLQLELFAAGHRGGSSYAHLMNAVAPRLTPDAMRDVAAFYAAALPTQPTQK